MLVIPVTDGLKKKFPIITIGLILINCLVFFSFQLDEDDGYIKALTYSRSSGLLQIETKIYENYLESVGEVLPQELQSQKKTSAFFWHMMQDDVFQQRLRAREVLLVEPEFTQWLELRQVFETKMNQIFSWRYGYSPARKNYIGLFTCMFLHGGIMHLLGNMVFLWFVGALLEIGVGRVGYLCGYLVAGVCASLAFGLAYPLSSGPLVGASGAIAGLMGAYGLIYGRAKIKVFYSLGFYFDYATISGWVLFPFWLGKEIVQLFTNTGSNVAYMAHIGGLVSGAGLAALYLAKNENTATEILEDEGNIDKVPALLEEGLQFFGNLQLADARVKIVEALELEPANKIAMVHLFNIDKCTPQTEHFHATARLLLHHLAQLTASTDIEKYFEEYMHLSSKPRVAPEVLLCVASVYIGLDKSQEASRLLTLLLKQFPQFSGVSACLLRLGYLYQAEGKDKQAEKCFRIISGKYPDSNSGRKACALLTS